MTPQYKEACRIRSTDAWQRVRTATLQRAPVCQWCGDRPAEEVHHVKPVAERPDLALTQTNLITVCTNCHRLIESAVKRGIDIDSLRGDG